MNLPALVSCGLMGFWHGQGDVGCGKTAVAFLALLAAAGSGYQAAIMLPTEILASQTHVKLQQLLQSMPEGLQPKLEFLTGSTKAKERREVRVLYRASRRAHVILLACLVRERMGCNCLRFTCDEVYGACRSLRDWPMALWT